MIDDEHELEFQTFEPIRLLSPWLSFLAAVLTAAVVALAAMAAWATYHLFPGEGKDA